MTNHKTKQNAECAVGLMRQLTTLYVNVPSPKLAQKKYKRRHDWVGRSIYWEVCGANGIRVKTKWYEHQTEAIIVNDLFKILWDFTVQTDHFITVRKPDMIVIDEEHHVTKLTSSYHMTHE